MAVVKVTKVISSGGTDSEVLALGDKVLKGIEFPADFTGTSITFKNDGATVRSADNSSHYTINRQTGHVVPFDPNVAAMLTKLVVVSQASEAADRTLTFYLG